MGITNICIPLNLYSKHIPSKKINFNFDYILFGHYDALTVGRNLYSYGSDFYNLWDYAVETADMDNYERNYSKQIIYAIRSETEDSDDYMNFWKANDLPPFLFFCIMQVGNVEDIGDCRRKIREDVRKKYKNGNIEIRCYSSLENNCILLVYRCDNFKSGLDVINTYHNVTNFSYLEGISIQYTYTIVGYKTSYDYSTLNEVIDNVHLYVIERSPGSAGILYNKLQKLFPGNTSNKQILGNDDELWELKNIQWSDFLNLYLSDDENSCILAPGSSECVNNAYSIATHFVNIHDNKGKASNAPKTIKKSKCKQIYAMLTEFKSIYSNCENNNIIMKRKGYYKSIMYIINSLEKFEYAYSFDEHFNDYTYFMIYNPLISMVDALLIATKLENIGISMRGMIGSKEIYRFLNSINSIVHHTIHSDRQFMQTPDFNAIIFEIPAKIEAFYGALINLESKLLKANTNVDYQFLIVPGLREYIKVDDVFNKLLKDRRLCTVEIPEHQMYEPQFTIPVLMHEIAHRTGSDIRMRDNRSEKLKELVAYQMATDLVCFSLNIKKDLLEGDKYNYQIINKIKEILHKKINQAYNIEIDEDSKLCNNFWSKANSLDNNDKEKILMKKNYKLTVNFEHNIIAAAEKVILNMWDDESIMLPLIKISDRRLPDYAFINELKKFVFCYVNNRNYPEKDMKVKNWCWGKNKYEIVMLIDTFREVYADLISIAILDITPEQYLNVIEKNNFIIYNNAINRSVIMLRISLTFNVMFKRCVWEPLCLEENENDGKKIQNLKKTISYLLNYAIQSDNRCECQEEQFDIPSMFKCSDVWDIITLYMSNCLDTFFKETKKTEKRKIYEEIKNAYIMISNIDQYGIDKVLKLMEDKIAEFKNDVYNIF